MAHLCLNSRFLLSDLVSGRRVNGCDEMGSGIICRWIIPPANQRVFFLVGLLHPGTGRVLIHVITARILPHLELKGREEDFFWGGEW